MIKKPTQLEVGRITKPHGLRGDVLVFAISNVADRWQVGSKFTTDNGELTVKTIAPYQDRLLVRFEEVNDRNGAEAIAGSALMAEPIEDLEQLFVHDLIGKHVVDQDGIDRGEVISIIQNPASDLLELDSGALVPLTFVTGQTDVISILVPDGLFE